MIPDFKRLLLAFSFYTRLPCPQSLDFSQLPRAAVYLPIIGWVVGGASALTYRLAVTCLPTATALLLATIVGVLLTGAFHEDGFADVCDGFGGGYGKERILAIMKDSAIGVYGALGLMLLLALKISALTALPGALAPWTLVAGHSLSRLMPLWLMRRYDYARSADSKSGAAMHCPDTTELTFAAITALVPLVMLPTGLWPAAFPVMLATLWLGRYFFKHIGGYTGDCLGACQQVTETVFYLSASVLWTFI